MVGIINTACLRTTYRVYTHTHTHTRKYIYIIVLFVFALVIYRYLGRYGFQIKFMLCFAFICDVKLKM